jgi:hypothetical protein
MRKKIALSLTSVVIILCGLMVYKNSNQEIVDLEIVEYWADNAYDIRNLEQLEELSDIIVKATVLPGSENVPHIEGVRMGRTYTDVKVQTVYKGDVSTGDIINITELYYYENDGAELASFNGYLPSNIGSEYVFFLGNSEDESNNRHYLIGAERGRYSQEPIYGVKNRTFSTDHYTFLEDTEVYRHLRKEVLDKYYRD